MDGIHNLRHFLWGPNRSDMTPKEIEDTDYDENEIKNTINRVKKVSIC